VLLRRLTIVLLAALALAACGSGAPAAGPATAPAAPEPPTDLPTSQPIAAPTSRSTIAAPPTQAPAPSARPAGATQPPEPSSLPEPTAAAATQAPQPTAAPQPAASFGSELLFLREGALIAFDTGTHKERQLANHVLDFAAGPAGAQIALVRDLGKGDASKSGIDLWVVARDGSNLSQLTTDGYDLVEATPSWSPDGRAIAFAAAGVSDAYSRSWPAWSLWCTASTIRLLDLQTNADQSLGRGCDPAISPDGRRIAYAAPPMTDDPAINSGPAIVNSLRLINRQGENGWNFAKADGPDAPPPHTGRLVYAPSWSLDGKQIVYHRFLGYQALVDLDVTEIAGSLEGKGKPLSDGAGWLLPARFAPDGRSVAITENNAGDPRGFGGYDN